MDCSLPGSSVHGDSPGKNTGVGCHDLLQGIFPTQESNQGLLHCRQIPYQLSYWGSPFLLSVQFTQSCLTLCDPMDCNTPGFPVHHQLPELAQFMSIKSVMPSNHLIPSCPLLLPPSIFPSIRVFSSQFFASGGQSIRVSASASVLPMNIQDWFPLGLTGWVFLQSKGLSSLLQHHNSKSSILWHSAFLIFQLSHPYMTTVKTIALTRWTFVSKVTYLCFLISCLGWS